MARTSGAKNKTWREWEALGKYAMEKSKLMRENEALKEALKAANEALKKAKPK